MVDQAWTPDSDLDRAFTVTAPTGGVTVHAALSGRDAADQHPITAVEGLTAALAAKADTAAIDAAVAAAVAALVDGAPGALDTLNELAAAVNDDATFAASVTAALAGKVPTTRALAGLDLSADRTAAALRTALDVVAAPSVSDPQWGALFFTGQYTAPLPRGAASALTANRLFFIPLLVSHTQAFDRIACLHEGSTGGAGSVARLGVYSRAADGNVGALHIDCGTVDLSTAGAFKAVTTSFTLTAGLWWLAMVAQVTSGTPTLSVGTPVLPSVPDVAQISGGTKFQNSVTGALPASVTLAAGNVGTPPCIWVRAA